MVIKMAPIELAPTLSPRVTEVVLKNRRKIWFISSAQSRIHQYLRLATIYEFQVFPFIIVLGIKVTFASGIIRFQRARALDVRSRVKCAVA